MIGFLNHNTLRDLICLSFLCLTAGAQIVLGSLYDGPSISFPPAPAEDEKGVALTVFQTVYWSGFLERHSLSSGWHDPIALWVTDALPAVPA